jgi:hypothetical protein
MKNTAVLLQTSGLDVRMLRMFAVYQAPKFAGQFECSVYASGATT